MPEIERMGCVLRTAGKQGDFVVSSLTIRSKHEHKKGIGEKVRGQEGCITTETEGDDYIHKCLRHPYGERVGNEVMYRYVDFPGLCSQH